jgi:hypothetical protein
VVAEYILRTAEPLSLWAIFAGERKSQIIGLDSILFDYFLFNYFLNFTSCFILRSYPCGFFCSFCGFFAFYLGSRVFLLDIWDLRAGILTPVESFRKGSKDLDSKNPQN